jgi:ABC-type branched-subunit amino acid transport system substrate-binding protein
MLCECLAEAGEHRSCAERAGVRWGEKVVLGVAAVVLAGCGARWTDDQQAAVASRSRSGTATGAAPSSGAVAIGGFPVEDAPVDGAPVAAEAQVDAPVAGDPGSAPAATAAGGAPCDAPSQAPGVAPGKLTIGTVATNSGPVPGLGRTSEAAVRAYVAYRNSTGGVCGRKLELLTGDDGADNGRFRAIVTDMTPRVLGYAGIFANGDAGGAEVVEGQKVPVVAAASTEQFQKVSTVFDINPPPADPRGVIAKYRYLREQGVTSAAIMTLSNGAAVSQLDQEQRLMEAAGIRIALRQILPLTTLSFDSAARAVANSGADYLFFLGAVDHDASMAKSMKGTGHELRFEEYLTGYGGKMLELAGSAAEGTSSWIGSLPVEDGGKVPEHAAYLKWMGQTAPGIEPDILAAQAWTSTKAFVDAVGALPGPITREALLAQIRTMTSYDAGGLLGRIDLANERNLGCLVGMRVEGGRWKRIAPAQGFLC